MLKQALYLYNIFLNNTFILYSDSHNILLYNIFTSIHEFYRTTKTFATI